MTPKTGTDHPTDTLSKPGTHKSKVSSANTSNSNTHPAYIVFVELCNKRQKPTYIVSHVCSVAHKDTFSPSIECPQCPRQIVAETTGTGRHTQEPQRTTGPDMSHLNLHMYSRHKHVAAQGVVRTELRLLPTHKLSIVTHLP